jgi:hypothetical protein
MKEPDLLYPDETNKLDLFISGLNRSNRIDPVLNLNREKPGLNPKVEGQIETLILINLKKY